jgi:hypothetical protein
MNPTRSPVLLICFCLFASALACGPKPSPPPPPGPNISGLSPASGTVGTTLTLTGANLGDAQDASTVTIGGVAATVTSWQANSIQVTVPDVFPGAREVKVTVDGTLGTAKFTVVLPRRLYSCDDGSPNTVSAYEIGTDGIPTPMTGSPYQTGGNGNGYGGMSNCIRIHAASRRLYAANADSVSIFSIDGVTGALTRLTASPASIAGRTVDLFSLEISPDGNRVYLPDDSTGEIVIADVAADGALTQVSGSPVAASSANASVLELRPDGAFLYSHPEETFVDVFSVASSGAVALTGPTTYTTAGAGWTLRLNRAGTKLAVGASNGLAVMNLDPTTGVPALAPGTPASMSNDAGSIAWSPDGTRLYATEWSAEKLYGWTVAADGTATAMAGSPWTVAGVTGNDGGLEVSSDGAFLYAAFETQGIATYSLGSDGVPTRVGAGLVPVGSDVGFLLATP